MTEHNVLDSFRLDGKVALITGGSKGLGESAALGLSEAGAVTVICARHGDDCAAAAERISARTGVDSVGIAMDVSDETSVKAGFAGALGRFGHVDVLVTAAGINERHPIEECSEDVFSRVLNTNLKGTWLCCREAARIMKRQRGGSVITVGSALSAVGLELRTPYCSSKAGILGLTRAAALEWAPYGIRCNALCPGPFLTEINLPIADDPEKTRAVVGRTAMNRWGELSEIRGAVVFLAGAASTYMTGSALYIDGGWTAQ